MFNILGPLTNPAGAKNQVMGVFHPDLVGIQAHVLQRLGSRHVMIVHGLESLDEISVAGPTMIGELKDDAVREYQIGPADFGLETHEAAAIRVDGAAESKAMLLEALDNKAGAARDIVALNAGASIYVAGLADTHAEGVRTGARGHGKRRCAQETRSVRRFHARRLIARCRDREHQRASTPA